VSPEINALATIMVLIVTLGIVGSAFWMQRQERNRQRDVQMAQAANE
jgi:putrescine transport system permease protein